MMAAEQTRSHEDYTIGWVCALSKELTAATAMLDVEHEDDIPIPEDDDNIYTRGSIGDHNIVIACLPEGIIGTNSAATVVKEMLRTFPSIRFGFMVGIGGGIPNIPDHDVRLGDVVVSVPQDTYGGVVQWDLGKAEQEGFKRTGSLNHPPQSLLSAVAKLRTQHERKGPRIQAYLDQMAKEWPLLAPKYLRSDALRDILFESEYPHDKNKLNNDCQLCDATRIVSREPRAAKMKIHYGLIASGNQVIKDAMVRDKLNDKLGGNVLCIEMEAAGLMNNFPCLVIRGICDYADAHKNKRWQEHAAAVAAAYAKELLQKVLPAAVNRERAALEVIQEVKENVLKTAEDLTRIRSDLKRQEDLAIIEWLTTMNHGSQHSLYRDRRQPETGRWFLDSSEYNTWKNCAGKVLFCQGIPGAGKSVLSALIIEELSSTFGQTAGIGLAYIYCDYQRHDQQTPLQLISSLTKQLCLLNATLPPCVKDLYNVHQPKSTTPSLQEICQVFQNIVRSFTQVYVVIDALDELPAKAGYRNTFLDELLKVKHSSPTLSMLFTSRPLAVADVRHIFSDAIKMEISAAREDIDKFIDGYLAQLSPDALIPSNDDLREEVKGAVAQAVSGMFLLARLYLDSLVDKLSPNQVRCALEVMKNQNRGVDKKSMEDTLGNAYDHTMTRITGQKKDIAEHAMYVLLWLTYTQRPLKVDELRHALAVKVGAKDLNRGDLIPHLNLSVYAGLAVIDDKTQEVRLVHYTTQEYLEQRHFKLSLNINPHVTITDVCVTYLMFSAFRSESRRLKAEYIERVSTYSLYLYAANYWSHHARLCSEPPELLLKFLGCNEATRGAAEADRVGTSEYYIYSWGQHRQGVSNLWSPLHTAVRYNLHKVAEALAKRNDDLNTLYDGKTPLYMALEGGDMTMARILLRKGAQVRISGAIPALEVLCDRRYDINEDDVSMVEDLLNRGAEIADAEGNCLLLVKAAEHGQEQLVTLLVQRGANVDSLGPCMQTYFGKVTPLFAAVTGGHLKTAMLLWKSGANPNRRIGRRKRSAFCEAVEGGNEPLVKAFLVKEDCMGLISHANSSLDVSSVKLLNHGRQAENQDLAKEDTLFSAQIAVDIELRDEHGYTPLALATKQGHGRIAGLLLGCDANIEAENSGGETPLLLAVEKEKDDIAKLLLEKGANVEIGDRIGRTPLLWAVEKGNTPLVELLIEKGANIEIRDDIRRTPLFKAVETGNIPLVELLIEKGANLSAKNNDGDTLLMMAAERGHSRLAELCLEKGVEINAVNDSEGVSALFFAVWSGHASLVELLLNNGATIEPQDKHGLLKPLAWAELLGKEDVARVLVEHCPDIRRREDDGETLLCLAVWGASEFWVWTLCSKRAPVGERNRRSQTPLEIALYSGNAQIVGYLCFWGADVEKKDSHGQKPLEFAVSKGMVDCVKALLRHGAKTDTGPVTLQSLLELAYEGGCQSHKEAYLLLVVHAGVLLDTIPEEHWEWLTYEEDTSVEESMDIEEIDEGVLLDTIPEEHWKWLTYEEDTSVEESMDIEAIDESVMEDVSRAELQGENSDGRSPIRDSPVETSPEEAPLTKAPPEDVSLDEGLPEDASPLVISLKELSLVEASSVEASSVEATGADNSQNDGSKRED